MKEKFIYPLLAILLAVISTNVSATVTPPTQITPKEKTFSWEGQIPKINIDFDWDFVDKFGNPYISTGSAFLTASYNTDLKSMDISGEAINLFIAPKNIDANIINDVYASLIKTPRATGLVNDTDIRNATDFDKLKANEVAIIVNNTLMEDGLTNSKVINKIGSDLSRFEIYIKFKALIPETNYIPGAFITFSVPVMFSVGVIKEVTL